MQLTLPETVTAIGHSAFAWSDIVSIEIPGSVQSIGENAFKKCRKLQKVVIRDGCKTIADGAFSSCPKLEEIILPHTLEHLGDGVFADDVNLPSVTLPEKLTTIPNRTFTNCLSLSAVTIPDCVTQIGKFAFNGCSALHSAILSRNLEVIGEGAFKRCSALESISFPASLLEIGDSAFSECLGLKVSFASSPKRVGRTVFPDTAMDAPDSIEIMYATSFLQRQAFRAVPEIVVPPSVRTLYCGFERLMNYAEFFDKKVNLRHVLDLRAFGCKLFIGEKYYSLNPAIIENGEVDFAFYDSQFSLASEAEKPYIAAVRLAYPVCLSEESRTLYQNVLRENPEKAAIFAATRNDAAILQTVFSLVSFSADFIDALYDTAHEKRHFGLLSLINTQKSDFDALFTL